jgi:glycosyltransferase involved in cell wall biosynthesis
MSLTRHGRPLVPSPPSLAQTDRLSPVHAERCNAMDEVWVPTEFHRQVFAASGVEARKLVVVPEPVDVVSFDPGAHAPLALPIGVRVLGREWARQAFEQPEAAAAGGGGGGGRGGDTQAGVSVPFVFLSIFKWEERKAWDVLLEAYLSAFMGSSSSVVLIMLTKPFHSDTDFADKIRAWAVDHLRGRGQRAGDGDESALPSVYVMHEHIAQQELPRLYKAASAFVLPSRWGVK